jgi:hypothetical protein
MNLPAKPAAATEADPATELRQMLASAAAALQALHQQAIEALAPAVQDILRSGLNTRSTHCSTMRACPRAWPSSKPSADTVRL